MLLKWHLRLSAQQSPLLLPFSRSFPHTPHTATARPWPPSESWGEPAAPAPEAGPAGSVTTTWGPRRRVIYNYDFFKGQKGIAAGSVGSCSHFNT